mmetsp:Transcript_23485/g.46744  ORF Transcript_23485/g.46744 Transcript_23485/m.46744 type:complete len:118 (+) Transcript_23485:138-491(+)
MGPRDPNCRYSLESYTTNLNETKDALLFLYLRGPSPTNLVVSNLVNSSPVGNHHLRNRCQCMALQLFITVVNKSHDDILCSETSRNHSSIWVMANKFTNIITSNRLYLFVIAGCQSN